MLSRARAIEWSPTALSTSAPRSAFWTAMGRKSGSIAGAGSRTLFGKKQRRQQMNCKPGDRAIVTRVRPPSAPGKDAAIKAMLGRVVKVVRLYWFNGLAFCGVGHHSYFAGCAFNLGR